jgi:membrane protein YdbS with pleckstrin-like domain
VECRREETVMLLTVTIFFLIIAIIAGVFALTMKGPLVPILFVVAFIMFVWTGIMHLRERRRGGRR